MVDSPLVCYSWAEALDVAVDSRTDSGVCDLVPRSLLFINVNYSTWGQRHGMLHSRPNVTEEIFGTKYVIMVPPQVYPPSNIGLL